MLFRWFCVGILFCISPLYGEPIRSGLVLDLNADRGVTAEGGRVTQWTNQVEHKTLVQFVPQDEGRKTPGAGRPTWRKASPQLKGHRAIHFQRQELVNFDEDALDHLITGAGHTWLAILRVDPQVKQLKDVNSFFGNLKNGKFYEGFWGNVTDDNRVWIGARNGKSFGRWDANNPMVMAKKPLETNQFYVVAGRMGAGQGEVPIELFIDSVRPAARKTIPVNPKANASKLAVGQERDATGHPGKESFDGEIARFLIYERPLSNAELGQVIGGLQKTYGLKRP